MSYSFSARAKTKEEILAKAGEEFAAIIASQPIHAKDEQPAFAAITALVSLLKPVEDEQIVISVSGSLGWRGDEEFSSANLSVSSWVEKVAS